MKGRGLYHGQVENWWLILIAAVIAMVIVLTWTNRTRRSRVDPTQVTIDPALAGTVADLYQQGKKLDAVKLLKERTGLSLADAVRVVEKIARRSQQSSPSSRQPARPPASTDISPSSEPVDLDTELDARSLVADGDKIQAIKLVRERTGWDLSRAKNYVEGL